MNLLAAYLVQLYSIFLTSAFLSPVLWVGWNYGATKFVPVPTVGWDACIVALLAFQVLSSFLLRKRDITYIPIYLPDKLAPEPTKLDE